MSTQKQNQKMVHGIIIVLSVLAGIGIFAAVNKPVPSSASTGSANTPAVTTTDPNFNYADNFLSQSPVPSQQYYQQSQPRSAPRLRTRAS